MEILKKRNRDEWEVKVGMTKNSEIEGWVNIDEKWGRSCQLHREVE